MCSKNEIEMRLKENDRCFPLYTPEIKRELVELEEERSEQINQLIQRGFHTTLGLSKEEYAQSIPSFLPQLESYKDRFDIPLVVETRIPLSMQTKLARIDEWIDPDRVKNLTHVPKGPYTIWTHEGSRHIGMHKKQAEGQFEHDEVGSPLVEVIALYIHYPDLFKAQGLDAPQSQGDLLTTPSIHTFHHGVPRVNSYGIHDKPERFGVLSRGSVINTGTPLH